MFSLARILIPIDFSERCLGATRYAIPLAERFNSEINLLHVFSPHVYSDDDMGGGVTDDEIAERRTKAQKQLDDFLNAALRHLRVKRTLVDGDPALRIVESGLREHPELIMMPTRGHGSFRRLLEDSVTVKVLHSTDCPVWTGVHLEQGPPTEWSTLGRIACAIDLSPDSEKALEWAAGFADEFKATLSLIHVVPRLDSPGEQYYSQEYHRRAAEAANESIARMQSTVGTHAKALLEEGDVTSAVCAAADRERADLLVIGRGLRNAPRLPTNTYAIIRKSSSPVVSV